MRRSEILDLLNDIIYKILEHKNESNVYVNVKWYIEYIIFELFTRLFIYILCILLYRNINKYL